MIVVDIIGDAELIAAWENPDFDASLRAFHDARLIEIQTPRKRVMQLRFSQ